MKSEWIKNEGECPVEKGVRVDVRYGDGVENLGVRALLFFDDTGSCEERNAHDWSIDNCEGDITHYRLISE